MYVFSCYLKLNLLIKGTNLAKRKLNALNFSFAVLVVQRYMFVSAIYASNYVYHTYGRKSKPSQLVRYDAAAVLGI